MANVNKIAFQVLLISEAKKVLLISEAKKAFQVILISEAIKSEHIQYQCEK